MVAVPVSDSAEVVFVPELNIDNDNIQCSHGATIGYLNTDAISYLMSRGVSRKQSISILINSFLLEPFKNDNIFSNILNKHIIDNYYNS